MWWRRGARRAVYSYTGICQVPGRCLCTHHSAPANCVYPRTMLRVSRLAESALVRIERVDHPADVPHVDPDEEVSTQYSINLLEQGHFSVVQGSRTWRIGAADVFLTLPGQVHRYVHDPHDNAPTDRCVAISFADAAQDDLDGVLRRRAPVVPLNNR